MRSELPGGNLLAKLPADQHSEVFETILTNKLIRIERIVSKGHTSPAEGWWDQEEDEWVLLLQGGGALLFEDGRKVVLRAGDYLFIPAHDRHKVTWTDPEVETIWLAVFWPNKSSPSAT